jgi:transposase
LRLGASPPRARGRLEAHAIARPAAPWLALLAQRWHEPGPLRSARETRERIEIALGMIDAIEAQIAPLERELRQLARRQTGCRALIRRDGMGELTSLVALCELGDVGRLSASRKAVGMAGIDIGVHRCDRRARVGKLTRQGSPQLRWALYEAALSACRPSSPDHADYLALTARGLSHTRASLTIARKLARRSLPRPARTPTRRPRSRHHHLTTPQARSATPALRHGLHASGRLPQPSRLPPRAGGGPPKTERPQSFHPD